ncbi:hypothetical protein [Parachitinimonas caeni]|uniref:YHS domain-containing protein n=1 Tax=Parachitinimonas caeni TaxID=3031301 RepID=A0ABT7E449_9NEIS|nr:hypothetical protein [Parachitinimonas caeni]MDK2127080.1 hypothetical protein [Parachitinimonas caeni]
MNGFTLLYGAIYFIVVYWAYRQYEALLGQVGALIVGFSLVVLFRLLLRLTLILKNHFLPIRPPCLCGRAGIEMRMVQFDYEKDEALFHCACGRRYLHRQNDFFEILDDGLRLYMKQGKYWQWRSPVEQK